MRLSFLFFLLTLCTSCSIGGRDETCIENLSNDDTLIVELFKDELSPRNFEVRTERLSSIAQPEIYYQSLTIDYFRAVLYNSLDTCNFKFNNNLRTSIGLNNWSSQNQVRILYYNQNKINLKVYLLPQKKLAIGVKSFLFKPEMPLYWDSVIVHNPNNTELRINKSTLTNFITDKESDRSCGDCGIENYYKIKIK